MIAPTALASEPHFAYSPQSSIEAIVTQFIIIEATKLPIALNEEHRFYFESARGLIE